MTSLQASTESQASRRHVIEEIENEITFQKVLLSSLDDTVENRYEQEQEILQDIKTLDKKLLDLKSGTTAGNMISQLPQSGNVVYPQLGDMADELGGATSVSTNYAHPQEFERQAEAISPASTLNSSDSFPELSLLSDIPSRKRTHSKHLDGGLAPDAENLSKSRRTSPGSFMSPYASPSTAAGTSSGDEVFGALDGGLEEQQAVNAALERQKAAEDKLLRERLDAEYARTLQDELPTFSARPSNSKPTAFDRMAGMRPTASSSTSATKAPSLHDSNPHKRINATMFPSFPSSSSMDSTVKPEPSLKSSLTFPSTTPGIVSQADTVSLLDDSDSDIEIIPPSAFQDNGRRYQAPNSMTLPSPTRPIDLSYQGAGMGMGQQHGLSSQSLSANNDIKSEGHIKNEGSRNAVYPNQPPHPWMDMPGSWPSGASGNATFIDLDLEDGADTGQYVYPSTPFVPDAAFAFGFPAPTGELFFPPFLNDMDLAYSGFETPYSSSGLNFSSINSAANVSAQSNPMASSQSIVNPFSDINRHVSGLFGTAGQLGQHPHYMHMADQIDYIMNDPRKTNEEIKSLLENIKPDVDLSIENREGAPDGLKYPLYEHQKIALTWLKSMENGTNKGGILADDMGLGKTISALALMLTRPSTDRLRKTTLIVGPVALVRQWEREIRTKTNASHRLSTLMFHGSNKKHDWSSVRNYDVVLTTYGTLAAELKRMEKWILEQRTRQGQNYDEAPMQKLFPMLGPKSLFYRVILDEAQCIKNKNTLSARAAYNLSSTYRLCLTGTPMMNGVIELYSLICFLKIRPYSNYTTFQKDFGCISKRDSTSREAANGMKKLQAVIKAILLRRTKKSEIDGKPIISLPPKTEEIQHVVFDEDERAFYSALETKTQIQFNKYLRAGTVGKNYSNVLVLLLRLRQCCCHPHLINDFDEAPPPIVQDIGAMLALAESLDPGVVARILAVENGAFECPVCYDAVQNPSIVIPCGHDTCSECLAKISEQAIQQNVLDGEERGGTAKCPTCRGQVDMRKIIDYASFKKVHKPDPESQAEDALDSSSDESGSESGEEDDDEDEDDDADDANSDGDLNGFVVPDGIPDESDNEDNENKPIKDDVVDVKEDSNAPESNAGAMKTRGNRSKKGKGRKKDKKGKGKEKEKNTFVSLATLKKLASGNAKSRRKYMKHLRDNWEPSAKITKCVELLDDFQKEGQKTIIFSQFVSLLDLLQVPIEQRGWSFERYDGSMSSEMRNDAIVRFTDKPSCKIMLISLKAGNAGLNLVAASRVIILDPFWNPYIEMQAVDRAYRIGQQNPVQVHRILIEGTVEDRIIELQEKKRRLVDSALDEGANKSLGRLDVRQLAYLFGLPPGGGGGGGD